MKSLFFFEQKKTINFTQKKKILNKLTDFSNQIRFRTPRAGASIPKKNCASYTSSKRTHWFFNDKKKTVKNISLTIKLHGAAIKHSQTYGR